ncbi:MAG: hypothetical protein M1817_005677 [Caeruleum heppii]|nr:MAG: hypothetical protein M1817_005677 [Caeruleum heppii]
MSSNPPRPWSNQARPQPDPYYHDLWADALTPPTLLAGFLALGYLLYRFIFQSDRFPILSPPEILWHALVYIMPSRILFALDQASGAASRSSGNVSTHHAAKSEALRRILRLQQPGLLYKAAAAGSFGSITRLNKAVVDERPPGLGNWDNSCYQNSVIQGLASLPPLNRYLSEVLREKSLAKSNLNPSSTAVSALLSILSDLNDSNNGGKQFWTPSELKSMSSWQQQDAQEYFAKILNEVEKDVVRGIQSRQTDPGLSSWKPFQGEADVQEAEGVKRPGYSDRLESSQKMLDGKKISSALRQHPKATEFPHDMAETVPVEGLLAQRVGCTTCGWSEGISLIPFISLTVSLGRDPYYDVRDCLEETTGLEDIEGVECAKCTLLRNKAQLERMLEDASMAREDAPGNGSSDAVSPPNTYVESVESRLEATNTALEEDDFSESTVTHACKVPTKNRATTTKSRQAVIARPPQCLVIHVNRSVFDEYSGVQRKNYAEVGFPKVLDLGLWCLGRQTSREEIGDEESLEEWEMDPTVSMLARNTTAGGPHYLLRAVITHSGRHENGHYVCYRRYPVYESQKTSSVHEEDDQGPTPPSRWWRLSDEDVSMVSEETVLRQGGVFMLFYDRIEPEKTPLSSTATKPVLVREAHGEAVSPNIETAALNLESSSDLTRAAPPIHNDDQPSPEDLLSLSPSRATPHHLDPSTLHEAASTDDITPPSRPSEAPLTGNSPHRPTADPTTTSSSSPCPPSPHPTTTTTQSPSPSPSPSHSSASPPLPSSSSSSSSTPPRMSPSSFPRSPSQPHPRTGGHHRVKKPPTSSDLKSSAVMAS